MEIEKAKEILGIEFSFLYDFLTPIIKDLEIKKEIHLLTFFCYYTFLKI